MLADIAGITQTNLSAYENDRRLPTAETLNRIVVAAGYRLVAEAGLARVPCPLPTCFEPPLPPVHPGDPPATSPRYGPATPPNMRAAAVEAVLGLADAISRQ